MSIVRNTVLFLIPVLADSAGFLANGIFGSSWLQFPIFLVGSLCFYAYLHKHWTPRA